MLDILLCIVRFNPFPAFAIQATVLEFGVDCNFVSFPRRTNLYRLILKKNVLVRHSPYFWHVKIRHIIQGNNRYSYHVAGIFFSFDIPCCPFASCFHFTRVCHFNVSSQRRLYIDLRDETRQIYCIPCGCSNWKATMLSILRLPH